MPDRSSEGVRLDKWLWTARFFKTRSQARIAVVGGKVHVNGERAKASRVIREGDELSITRGVYEFHVIVRLLSDQRKNAAIARELYVETDDSIAQREELMARRRMERAGLHVPKMKPGKGYRRQLIRMKRE